MAKGEINVNACYNAIIEILEKDEEYKEITGNWMSTEELHKQCKKKVKGLREIEFFAALEMENDEYSLEVEKYLKRIKYI
ncbi:MAG TPA: hypothetical protein DEG71_06270 [Clostridiales bacterium]|nr:hypothetical protein [Clostridiales bacterium]